MADKDFANIGVGIVDLLVKEKVLDSDLLIVEDDENTKQVTFRNLRLSFIDDESLPANFRIYSSAKIQKMIDDAKLVYINDIGSMHEDIDYLKNNKVDNDTFSETLAKFDKEKIGQLDYEKLKEELDNTRKITVPITCADLSTATDAEKIHIEHLGLDVLSAMTGNTKVTVPSVPLGGWVSEDLANGSITSLKLSKDFMFRGTYPEGDLNRLVETGYYEVAATVEGVPHYGYDMDETRLLEVIRYGKDGKYIIQRVYYKETSEELRPYFERKGLFQRLSILKFTAHFEITDANKVNTDTLGDEYNNRGHMAEGNIFEVTASGNYCCEPAVKGLPTRARYMVSVRNFGDRREFEAKLADINGCVTYVCFEYHDSAGTLQRTEWFNITNKEKSKFDGKYLHIFGDSLSTGEGVDEPSKSYVNMMASKYGYRVYNHAMEDATMGNYDDNQFKTRSIITQIDTATGLNSTSEGYAIIFAGGEDYRAGVAPIGGNNRLDDTTFIGSLNTAIKELLERSPKLKLMIVCPPFRASTEPNDGYDGDTNLVNSKYMSDFTDAMESCAIYNHIPCLNLYKESGINKFNHSVYLDKNGIFLNEEGENLIMEKIHDGLCRFY